MHEVLCQHDEDEGDDYHCNYNYSVVRCRGCGKPSFRYVYSDYEMAYPTGVANEPWDVPTTIEIYPKILSGHKALDGEWLVPEIVGEIYRESLTAIKEGAYTLAGLGLRGTIEAICNDRGISGRNLETRISKLSAQGLISQQDAKRLHAIRFLGNDAAHEIKKPSKVQLDIALRIVEHMFLTIYILDEEARGSLDTLVDDFSDFERILRKKIKAHQQGVEYPLAKFLDKDVRRLSGGLSPFESQLIASINSQKFDALIVGKIDHYDGSQSKLQHFIVV